MSSIGVDENRPPPSVFLSYATEDRQAARRIGDALPALGLEVWYDESELGGGDAWDQKIRRQIRDCDYFMALVSAQTEARHEGYFRREWRLAVERTLDMADDHTFLLPIAIDGTNQAGARVPEKFLAVQWLRVPGGEPTPAFEALCRRLASGVSVAPSAPKKLSSEAARPAASVPAPAPVDPEFPREEPGQRLRFWFAVAGWATRSAWKNFMRLPRWLRIIAYIWIATALLSKGCTPENHPSQKLSRADAEKLKAISDQYQGSSNKADVAKLGMQIASEFSHAAAENATSGSPLLVIPFNTPEGDAAAAKLADTTFAQIYGRVSLSHPGHVGLSKDPHPLRDLAAALERGRANHSNYVLWGMVEPQGKTQLLTVKIVNLADGLIVWSKAYPAAGADAAKIATEVDSKVPALEEDQ